MKAERAIDAGIDRELAEAVVSHGDETAFRELYRRHTPRLLGFVTRLLAGTGDDEADVVQETWIRACESLARFRWESAFSTWLTGIGLNVVRDRLRRLGRSRLVSIDSTPDRPVPRPAHETRIDLDRAIRALPDDFRIVLVLHDVEGMTHPEIAGKLQIPVGTTKSQLSRARKLIRNMLNEPSE